MTTATPDPVTAWREWRSSRDAKFADPYGWLSLTALEWLDAEPGTFDGLPGRWWADTDGFHADPEGSGEPLLVDGVALTGSALVWDLTGTAPQVVQGGRRIELIVRGPGLNGVRVRDPQAPALLAFRGVPAFEYDPAWRVPASYRAYPAAEEVGVGSAAPRVRHTQVVTGEVTFSLGGSLRRLKVNDGTWIAFRDASNGDETNPNCRWVEVDVAAADAVVDFNFSANPPCAFTDYGTCPLPPAGNALDVRVLAGERDPRPGG